MELVRIHVTRLGRGYIAESRMPEIIAMGPTAEEAAENARRQALELLGAYDQKRAHTMIVRLTEPGRESIAMQSLLSAFSLRDSKRALRE